MDEALGLRQRVNDMGLIEDVVERVRTWEIPDAMREALEGGYMWDGTYSGGVYDLDADMLASSFEYHVQLDTTAVKDEHAVPLGTSKHRGLPHMPRSMAWPDQLLFDTQINLAELAEVDVSGRLPAEGMLYFFQSNSHGALVQYWKGDPAELEVREYPPESEIDDARWYLKDFLKESATLKLVPGWRFYINDGDAFDYRAVLEHLPAERIAEISAMVSAEYSGSDHHFRIYGRPQYWQGEDEGEMPVGYDEDDNPIWADPKPRILLLQTDLADAEIHFWCDPEAAARGDFSAAWESFSGT